MADYQGSYGSYQFNDGSNLVDVIKLTEGLSQEKQPLEDWHDPPALSGGISKVLKLAGQYFSTKRP